MEQKSERIEDLHQIRLRRDVMIDSRLILISRMNKDRHAKAGGPYSYALSQ